MTTLAPRPSVPSYSNYTTTNNMTGSGNSGTGGGMYSPQRTLLVGSSSLSTTPRSSRRLTVNPLTPSRPVISLPVQHQPLPKLNPRPYRTQPYAQDSTFQQRLNDDWQALDYAVQTMADSLSTKRKDINASLAEIDEERRRIEAATKGLGELAKEMQKEMKKEAEEQREAKGKKVEVEHRARTLEQQMDSITAEIREEQKKLAARRELKARQREAFQRQQSKNGPELAFFEDKLGLKIKGIGRDLVQFQFTNIDSRNYQRTFSYNIDASKPAYEITVVAPSASFLPMAELQPLVDGLNKNRDLYGFTREMRCLFKEEVALEKLGGDATVKEAERHRIRAAATAAGR